MGKKHKEKVSLIDRDRSHLLTKHRIASHLLVAPSSSNWFFLWSFVRDSIESRLGPPSLEMGFLSLGGGSRRMR